MLRKKLNNIDQSVFGCCDTVKIQHAVREKTNSEKYYKKLFLSGAENDRYDTVMSHKLIRTKKNSIEQK